MNYNALLLLDKKRKFRNNYSINISNLNQISISNQKINNHLNIQTNLNQKYKQCFSVKPSLYIMPKDIILKDIFYNSIKYCNIYTKKFNSYNNNNSSDIDRKYIFDKIKKFITINNINHKIYTKTIYLYDYLLFEKERISKNNKKYANFCSLPNLSIALIAFILMFKFNFVENKMISLKKFVKNFEEKNEKITFNNVCEMEILALQLLNYNLTFLTPFSFMELFLLNGIIFSDDHINNDLSFNVYELVNETLENIMVTSNEYFKYNYFYLCCSTVMYVREKFKIVRWPKALEIAFKVRCNYFYDIYNYFYAKNNKKVHQNNIKGTFTSNVININNLKSMANIISVLKIMKSADKNKKAKEKIDESDLFRRIKDKEDICKDKNNNNAFNNFSNIIKVGLNKNLNLNNFKSPGKNNVNKSSVISSSKKALNEEVINKGNRDVIYNNKTIERVKITNTNGGVFINKDDYNNDIEKSYNNNITKSCSRYRKNVFDINKFNREIYNANKIKNNINSNNNFINSNNISNSDSCYDNNSTNINYYKRRKHMDKKGENLFKSCPDVSKEMIHNNNNKYNTGMSTINNNIFNSKMNTIDNNNNDNDNDNSIMKNRYYNNYTEKRRKIDYDKNNDLKNQTYFGNFVFNRNKNKKKDLNSDKDNENYTDNYTLKKEENSNDPTCESSNNKLSLNDYSIRRNYRYKKTFTKNEETKENKEKKSDSPKNEINNEEGKKMLEKNDSFNNLINNKITFSDNTYNRRIGVRKYYKQKKSRDYH